MEKPPIAGDAVSAHTIGLPQKLKDNLNQEYQLDSFHRADWLSLSQSIATLIAVGTALAVVFIQHRLQASTDQAKREAMQAAALEMAIVFGERTLSLCAELRLSIDVQAPKPHLRANLIDVLTDHRSTFALLPLKELPETHALRLWAIRSELTKIISIFRVQPSGPLNGAQPSMAAAALEHVEDDLREHVLALHEPP